MRQKFEAIRVTQEVHQQAKFLAQKSGKSISNAVSEIIGSVFQIACTFNALNLSYDYEISESRVTITVEGSNNLKSGEFDQPITTTNAETDAKVRKLLKKGK